MKNNYPTHPTNTRNAFIIAMIILCAIICIVQYYISGLCFNPNGSEKKEIVLQTGVHLVKKYPFMIVVPKNEIAILSADRFKYHITYHKAIVIPPGKEGIITDTKSGGYVPFFKLLPPGKYHINTKNYSITLIDSE